MKRPPLTLKDILAAVGVVSIGVTLLYPAVQAFAWGLENPLLALVIVVMVGLACLTWKQLHREQPEGPEPR